MPAIPEPPERFGDEVIELREISEWDIPETLLAFDDDPELHVRIGRVLPPTGAELGSEIDHKQQERLDGIAVKLTIVEPGDNDWRGRVQIDGFDWQSASAGMRVWTAPRARGRGYERRAAQLAAAWLFENVAVERLEVNLDGERLHLERPPD